MMFAVVLFNAFTAHAACLNPVACDPTVNYFPSAPTSFSYSTTVAHLNVSNTFISFNLNYASYLDPTTPLTEAVVLVRCGCPAPTVPSGTKVIHVPIASALVQQTVTIPKIVLLGQLSKITFLTTRPNWQSTPQ